MAPFGIRGRMVSTHAKIIDENTKKSRCSSIHMLHFDIPSAPLQGRISSARALLFVCFMLQNALKLRFVQLAVDAALLKQLLMRALLDNDAVFHHEYAIRREHGR